MSGYGWELDQVMHEVRRAEVIVELGSFRGGSLRVWRKEFTASHLTYRPVRIVVFSSKVRSYCGQHEDSGPFYCPGDRTVYLDLTFFTDLADNARAGSAAQAFIVESRGPL